MPEIQIRPAVAEDIPHLVELDHDYTSDIVWQMEFQQTEEGQMPLMAGLPVDHLIAVHFRQARLPRSVKVDYPRPRRMLSENWMQRSGLLVAQHENQVVGYASLMLGIGPQATWMTDLAVMRRLRRQGVGSALVLAGLEWARQHGSQRLILEMQPKNHPAISLAQKLGFDFCGYLDRYYPNHDIALFFSRSAR